MPHQPLAKNKIEFCIFIPYMFISILFSEVLSAVQQTSLWKPQITGKIWKLFSRNLNYITQEGRHVSHWNNTLSSQFLPMGLLWQANLAANRLLNHIKILNINISSNGDTSLPADCLSIMGFTYTWNIFTLMECLMKQWQSQCLVSRKQSIQPYRNFTTKVQ